MGANTPLVSLGMPVFNGAHYLEETLNAILGQTFTDFELIISDNASTDQTLAICQAYTARDPRIKLYHNTSNIGAGKNYNRVFELATGRFFKWAAHDDRYAPEYLARCVDVLMRESTIVICYTHAKIIDATGKVVATYADGLNLRSPQPHVRLRDFLARPGLGHPIFGLIRTEALRQTALIGNYPVADRVIQAELALHGEFHEIPEPLFYRRFHPEGSTESSTTDKAIAAWYDPRNRGRVMLPRWKRLVEYLLAIHRAPLSPGERLKCYREIARLTLVPRRWEGLIYDLLGALHLASGERYKDQYDWKPHVQFVDEPSGETLAADRPGADTPG